MNPPATVSRMSKFIAFVGIAIAFVSLETPTATGQTQSSRAVQPGSLPDGTYLFGETPRPDQISKSYVVFQRQQGKVVGAFYYPRSEFECFTGSLKSNVLDVKSVGSSKPKVESGKVDLSNLHQIKSVSANDQRILRACKQATVALAN